MTMDRTLDARAICNVNEIRKLPRAMRRICFTPIYPAETFANGALSSTYFYVIAVWGNKYIDEPLRHAKTLRCSKAQPRGRQRCSRLSSTRLRPVLATMAPSDLRDVFRFSTP